jgi:hemolysin type calcium-binding protein
MKKTILIALMLFAALPVPLAHAETEPVALLLEGDNADNSIRISLTPDGRYYAIESKAPLEVGGDVCVHPESKPNDLLCEAPRITGFEVNAGGGADDVQIAHDVPIPATLRGGPGADTLSGGEAADKILGGPGTDLLFGRRGNDWLYGGPGRDRLLGGPGDDQLFGGPGVDVLLGGSGHNELTP